MLKIIGRKFKTQVFCLLIMNIMAIYHLSPYSERNRVQIGVENGSLRIIPLDRNEYSRTYGNQNKNNSKWKSLKLSTSHLNNHGNMKFYPKNNQITIDDMLIYSFDHHDSEVLTNYEKIPKHFEDTQSKQNWTIIPIDDVNRKIYANKCLSRENDPIYGLSFYDKYIRVCPEIEFIEYSRKYQNCLDNYTELGRKTPMDLDIVALEPVYIKNSDFCMTVVENIPEGIEYLRTYQKRGIIGSDAASNNPINEYSLHTHPQKAVCNRYASLRLRMRACTNAQNQMFFIWKD